MKGLILTTVLLAGILSTGYYLTMSNTPVVQNGEISLERRAEFKAWHEQMDKTYAEEEYEYRLGVFHSNMEWAEEFNKQGHSFVVGATIFADLTNEEYQAMYLNPMNFENKERNVHVFTEEEVNDAPASVDWTTQGAVTPVKNQGSCGSCWAFSTTGAMEGMHQIATGELVSLSEQQLVDCSSAQGNEGCNGGLMDNGFTYAEAHPLTTEDDYKYTGEDGTCNSAKVADGTVGVKSFVDVTADTPAQLVAALAQQPVSVAVDGASIGFQLYFGGILDWLCGDSLDHGVLAVGYGTEGSKDFYKVKNSWGSSWGESGYIRLGRTSESGHGMCGIQMQPSYPTA